MRGLGFADMISVALCKGAFEVPSWKKSPGSSVKQWLPDSRNTLEAIVFPRCSAVHSQLAKGWLQMIHAPKASPKTGRVWHGLWLGLCLEELPAAGQAASSTDEAASFRCCLLWRSLEPFAT